ncbi:MAG: vWA domain-containing protein [Pseudonocardiaceae bacterium]
MTRRGVLLPSSLLRSQLRGVVGARPGGRDRSTGVGYRLGDPGWPAEMPTLLIAVFDNSGSVTSPAGTDPLSNRFAEVAHAFSVVAQRGSRHELGAVLHFDTPCSGDAGPVPLTRRGLMTLRAGLRVPPDGAGSSELAPSLRCATGIAGAHAECEATLVVLSDFQLLDPDPSQVLAELAAFPGDVHAVVLGGHLAPGMLDERITVTRVGPEDPPGAVARALFASLITHRPGSAPSSGET